MEPEDGFGDHVDRRRHVVEAPHVTQLVGDDGFNLRTRQMTFDVRRQQEDRVQPADDTRFEQTVGQPHLQPRRHLHIEQFDAAARQSDIPELPGQLDAERDNREETAGPDAEQRQASQAAATSLIVKVEGHSATVPVAVSQ